MNPIVLDAHNPGPLTGRGNNTYVLFGDGPRAVLIDAGVGHPKHLAAIDEALAIRHAHLVRVLVTHAHRDHASGAPLIAKRHAKASFAKFPWPEEDSRGFLWQPLADGQAIDAGGETLTVVHTPGHSPDHVAFWDQRARVVFTGDLVIPGGSVVIPATRGGDLSQYLRSLERVLALDAVSLYPAHGPLIDDPRGVLTGHIEHRRVREQQVIDALRRGLSTVPEVAESIYDGLEPALMDAALENVRAHLAKLQGEGRVRENEGRWSL